MAEEEGAKAPEGSETPEQKLPAGAALGIDFLFVSACQLALRALASMAAVRSALYRQIGEERGPDEELIQLLGTDDGRFLMFVAQATGATPDVFLSAASQALSAGIRTANEILASPEGEKAVQRLKHLHGEGLAAEEAVKGAERHLAAQAKSILKRKLGDADSGE